MARKLLFCEALKCSIDSFFEIIKKMYVDEKKSANEIAEELSRIQPITAKSINRWLKDRGVMRSCGDAFRLAAKRGRVHWAFKDPKIKVKTRFISSKIRYAVLQRDNYKCVKCGNSASECPLEVDHIMPRCRGGITETTNLQTLCRLCNEGKRIVEKET
ncbi:MAG: HNH endonuclease [Patescibacteria group bacterium]